MAYRGHMQNGRVVLDEAVEIPDGAAVSIRLLDETEELAEPTLYERLKPVIGMAEGLPSDLAENHDHYLHGLPKK